MEGSDKLVAGLKEINDTSKEIKKEEIALGLRIHEEIFSISRRRRNCK